MIILFDAYDKANSMADILAAAFGLLTLGNDNLWNTLGKDETDGKQFAIKMKDIGKTILCDNTIDQCWWQIARLYKTKWVGLSSATNSSENGSGNNNTSNDTSGNVGMFGSLAAISMMLSDDENYDPLITTNSFLYDKTKDLMYYQVLGTKTRRTKYWKRLFSV
jgi:hypothetical protein